ncbi:MAG: hypothetical protein ACTHMW_10705 [Actinomycetes bacterium]
MPEEPTTPTSPNDAVSLPAQGKAGVVGLLPEQQTAVTVAPAASDDREVTPSVAEVDDEAVRLALPRQGDAPEAVTCPACGAVSFVAPSRRDAAGFCPSCDFPLFWAGSRIEAGADDTDDDGAYRRLPGTVGRTALASLPCPQCRELNQPAAVVCVRCGSAMHPVVVTPAPVPVAVVEPEVVPEPDALWWPPFAAAAVLGLLIILAMILAG